MTLRDYSAYADEARQAANARYKQWMIPLVVAGAIAGGLIGSFGGTDVVQIVIGALAGAVAGLLLHALIKYFSADSQADERYTADWCLEHGCRHLESFDGLPNAPYANSGHSRRSTDAIQGVLNGLPTLFYNFKYTTGSGKNQTTHHHKIMQISGPTLPVASLNFNRRGPVNIRMLDRLDSTVTSQRHVELESIDFNEKFKLEMDDHGDDVWVRQVFDPVTIDALVTGTLDLADIRYYDGAFWMVDDGQYDADELNGMLGWQIRGAAAVRHFCRVQGNDAAS
ncbi:MAG TPA: hypothetical protein VGO97_05320 [Solirubrobacterales bacterium]|jgi:hypothetical protein|nr:hypothetical protein [Solirubrobacterales bacterium]